MSASRNQRRHAKKIARRGEVSRREQVSRSQQAGMALLRTVDNFSDFRQFIGGIAEDKDEWAGIPMPLDDQDLVIHPRFPNADKLVEISGARLRADREEEARATVGEYAGWKFRNSFWSWHKRCDIIIWEKPDGKVTYGLRARANHLTEIIQTMGASVAWGIEQEQAALKLLGTMIRHHQFKMYLLTGTFMEYSARSRLHYVFRRLRPTVALHEVEGRMKILCALCLHPIAYYAGTWAGAMCPTDDVIAHLALMRGDEPMLWRRANQHPAWRPEAGI